MATTPATRWKLGLFVVVGLALAIGALFWLGVSAVGRETLTIVTYFDESVQGLSVGSAVTFRGAPIGTVSRISVAPDRRRIEVECSILVDSLERLGLVEPRALFDSKTREMPAELRTQLTLAGLTGLALVRLDFFDPEAYPPPALPFPTPPNYIPSVPSVFRDIREAVLVALARLPDLEARLTGVLGNTDDVLAEVKGLVRFLGAEDGPLVRLLTRFDRVGGSLDRQVQEAHLGKTAASVRGAADALAEAARRLGAASAEFDRAAQRVADASEQVGRNADGVAADLRGTLEDLGESAESIRALADYLERDPGALLRGRAPGSAGPPGGVRDAGRR
ncbi:MAG TPA: MlaD family protein [Thermodesulfobacteriota bacterium]